jgi:hypothetical protein
MISTFEAMMESSGVRRLKSHVPYLQWQCKRKLVFLTEVAALKHTRRLKHKYRVYQCDRCEGFHLTRRGV